MKQMKQLKYLGYGSVLWLFLFIIDYAYHLLHINKSGVVMTVLGLKIETLMEPNKLFTQFSLTLRALITYIIFIIVCNIIFTILNLRKRSNV